MRTNMMSVLIFLRLGLVLLCISSSTAFMFIPKKDPAIQSPSLISKTLLCPISSSSACILYYQQDYYNPFDDSSDAAQPLPLSKADIKRIQNLETRSEATATSIRSSQKVIPIVLLDALLPNQRLYFSSSDPKFEQLLEYMWQNTGTDNTNIEIGILGFHSETGEPLLKGVTAKIPYFCKDSSIGSSGITYGITRNKIKIIATSFKATSNLFIIVGEPWMDPTESFYLAHVEIHYQNSIQNEFERMTIYSQHQYQYSEQLFAQIPQLIEEWKSWMFTTEWCTPATLSKTHQLKEIGTTIPRTSHFDRAIWVAALLNPVGGKNNIQHQLQQLEGVLNHNAKSMCQDIRPAMLMCQNDYDRLVLAVSALQSRCDFLKQYWQEQQQHRPKR